jgi:hypothetical protein
MFSDLISGEGRETKEDLERFLASPGKGTVLEALGLKDTSPSPQVTILGQIMITFLHNWLSIHTLGFLQPVPHKTKQLFENTFDLTGWSSSSFNLSSFQDKTIPTQKGWVQETQAIHGSSVESAILIKAWTLQEAEMEVKDEVIVMNR